MRDLSELTALVTGGSRGIGRALCVTLVEAGATVYTCARSRPDLESIADQTGTAPGELHWEVADVTDDEQVDALYERIEREAGSLDVLVNNAGILGEKTPIEAYPPERWRTTMRVNVDGTFLASRGAIPLLRRAEHGLILNVSSSVGREGRAEWGAYSVSKFGVEGLTEILAGELREDDTAAISVNPGGTATDMRAEAYPDEHPDTLPSTDEVADTFVLLIRAVGVDETGRRYNSRELFELTGRETPPAGGEIPHVS